ncbi:MAG: hypothetical protein KAR79_00545 [Simkaniaceae bacterium]|nr:hypothetical protein [Simkaniaceae bacterium]
MNILKKAIVGVILAINTAAICDEVKNEYNYWGIGAGFPTILSAKFGHRKQIDHHGYEFGVGVTPLVFITEGHVFGSYLYYPNPNIDSQSYFGLGLRAGGLFVRERAKFGYIAPGIMFGREYLDAQKSRRFVQLAVGAGGLTTEGLQYLPSISLAFGYSF